MRRTLRPAMAIVLSGLMASLAAAQEKISPPAAQAVAAVVNGQEIPEIAVRRGLQRVSPEKQAEVRSELLNFLIDTVLVDQYLAQFKIEVTPAEVEQRLKEIADELKKHNGSLEKLMQELQLTDAEIRTQIANDLRWQKFVNQQAIDKVLREFFDQNPEMFDGTMVRARHILLTPASGDPKAIEETRKQLLAFKQKIEQEVREGMAGLSAQAEPAAREKTRAALLEQAFAEVARKESACPSKVQGGDLGFFPRVGTMVEPFARAAFALKQHEVSDVVATQFGQHLILAVERRPGKETSFEEVKDIVKDIYADRLRGAIIEQMRTKARINILNKAVP